MNEESTAKTTEEQGADQNSPQTEQPTAEKEQEGKKVVVEAEDTPVADIDVEKTDKQEGSKGSADTPPTLEEALKVNADLQLQLRKAQAVAKESQEQALRLQADFSNFRKRQEKELSQTIRFANEDLLKQLLPVLDDFERTVDAMEKSDNLAAIKEGIVMVTNKLRRQFTKIGLEPIEAKGKPFDSEIHEAITTVPVEDKAQKGLVFDEVEKGYKLKDRVIRYAKVVVSE